MPVMAAIGLPRKIADKQTIVDRFAHWLFQPVLRWGLRHPLSTLGLVAVLTIGTTVLGLRLGSEFVPRLNEGSLVINTIRLSGVSLEESLRYGTHIEGMLKKRFPDEIEDIWTRTGSAEVATDPMGLELSDIFITLKPRSEWKRAKTQDELVAAMASATKMLPGMRAVYTQPIEMRINEMVAGIRADLGIKLYGEDLDTLIAKAAEIEKVVKSIPGAADTTTEQVTGLPVLRIRVDNEALSRYGVPAQQVLDAVKAVGGINVGEIIEPGRRFPLVIRLPMTYREDPQALEQISILTASGQRLPLTQLVRIEESTGPSMIQRDWGERRIIVQTNVRGRDIGSFVNEAQMRIGREIALPVGYTIEWGGQFEHLKRAERRLYVVVPLAMALILSLLYLTFHSLRDAVMIFSGVLFARVGGILGLYVMGLPFTISAGVGFVALAGASILEGLILVSSIRDRITQGVPKREAIEQARLARLRPVLMTGTVAALGFVPMMLATGVGAEVQRPLATVIVFGMACDTFLTMLALPVLYLLFADDKSIEGPHGVRYVRACGDL
jgi:cobalt-zinc-cadmium resistance protein CzcA